MWRTLLALASCALFLVACEKTKPQVPVEKKAAAPAAKKPKPVREKRTADPAYAYKIMKHETPQELAADSETSIVVRMKNSSDRTWQKQSTVKLGCYWTDESGKRIPDVGGRADVIKETTPGKIVAFKCRVKTPPEPGKYYLVWDLVEKKVGWFESKGASPLKIAVQVG
jgi:hypothetical protein